MALPANIILAGDIVNLEERYGQITNNLDVHEYQVYELEYNLTLYDEETEIPNVAVSYTHLWLVLVMIFRCLYE